MNLWPWNSLCQYMFSIGIFYKVFQALHLILIGVFGALDELLASCMTVNQVSNGSCSVSLIEWVVSWSVGHISSLISTFAFPYCWNRYSSLSWIHDDVIKWKHWPVTRSFDVFFDLRLNKRLSKQSWDWWFETLSLSLWRHRNVLQSQQSVSHLFSLKVSSSEKLAGTSEVIFFRTFCCKKMSVFRFWFHRNLFLWML